MTSKKAKIIAVVGSTATGKTKLGVYLADIFNGEIISADSRQVYKYLDIGTGKDLQEYKIKKEFGIVKRIKHHMIDVIEPQEQYNLSRFQKNAKKIIKKIIQNKKLPILVGGTGLYINAITEGYNLSKEKIDKNYREYLSRLSLKELKKKLIKTDETGKFVNRIDLKNPRRIIRAIERLKSEKKEQKNKPEFQSLKIGYKMEISMIRKKISKRIDQWLKQGLIEEVENLKSIGLSDERMKALGLEYRYVNRYLNGIIKRKELKEQLVIKTGQYAKRQITWFKRDKNICWIKEKKQAKKIAKNFLNQQLYKF